NRQRDHRRAAAESDHRRTPGRPRLPGQDDRGLAGAPRARARISGRCPGWAGPSATNSIFSQVFVYNGFGRLDQASSNQLLTRSIGLALGRARPSWHRLLSAADGRDSAWLIPAALVALAACALASGLFRKYGDTESGHRRMPGEDAGPKVWP